jgi:hypothetical protein
LIISKKHSPFGRSCVPAPIHRGLGKSSRPHLNFDPAGLEVGGTEKITRHEISIRCHILRNTIYTNIFAIYHKMSLIITEYILRNVDDF